MATMDRDLDALERALQAVKTRSASALLNEQSYLARIAQLEEVNRSLQAQLTVQGAAPAPDASAADHHVSRLQDGVEGMKRSSSYMSMRTKSNHLVVAQLDTDGHGSDDGTNIGDAERRAGIERERERLKHENADLRSILKQYLDGISVNEDVINNPNPLLVVNHKTNVVMPSGYQRPPPATIVEGAHTVMSVNGELAQGRQGASI